MISFRGAAASAFLVLLALLPLAAAAHPLGNFTINRLVEVRSAPGGLLVKVVIDTAEIPTFQLMQAAPDEATRDDTEQRAVSSGLQISIDGARAAMPLVGSAGVLRAGAARLPIYYWSASYRIRMQAGPHTVRIVDGIADDHLGWRDVIVGRQSEPTNELRSYPNALLSSPRDVTAASFLYDPATAVFQAVRADAPTPSSQAAASYSRSNLLSDMFSRQDRTPWFVVLTIVAAFGLGALHALEPGHGKALMAFTLVGARATARQAIVLATSLTIAHTAGVFALGFALFFITGFAAESVYPWITLISGAVIAIVGARSLGRYFAARHPHAHGGVLHDHSAGHVHTHTNDHHHGANDGHTHDGGHSHIIPGEKRMKFGPAVWAAMSGGIAPCPAAIVVMLAALRLHQLGYGMLLIVVFSAGLASVLSGIGLAVVHGGSLLKRSGRFDRAVAFGPLASAALISLIGSVMVAQGFTAQHVAVPQWIVAALVATAIGAYAVTANHTHAHTAEAS